jgi:hypothetical protein
MVLFLQMQSATADVRIAPIGAFADDDKSHDRGDWVESKLGISVFTEKACKSLLYKGLQSLNKLPNELY